MDSEKNIQFISDAAICTACGACAGICPKDAISIVENKAGYLLAKVNDLDCINCGKCLEICPSNQKFTLSEDTDLAGNYLSCYVGHATDPHIRSISQSGGVVTALLTYLKKTNSIDGAIINQFSRDSHHPEVKYVADCDSILKAAGSYYTQSSVVKCALNNQDKRTAAVVLGCQAESLYLIKNAFSNYKMPDYIIGLICAEQNSGYIIDDLLNQTGYDKRVETLLECRLRYKDPAHGGWPGDVYFKTNKDEYFLPNSCRHKLKTTYKNFRCLACFDKMNIFSDIVCGDPWGIKDKHAPEGNTVVIARTEKGKNLLGNAVADGVLLLEPLTIEEIISGQHVTDSYKKNLFTTKQIFDANQWRYPYRFSKDSEQQSAFKVTKPSKILNKQLHYSRKLYLSDDVAKVNALFVHSKKQTMQKEAIKKPFRLAKKKTKAFLKKLHLL